MTMNLTSNEVQERKRKDFQSQRRKKIIAFKFNFMNFSVVNVKNKG